MSLHTVVGQPRAVQALQRALEARQLNHALLFVGPDGVGKETCAFRLAQALVCTQAPWHGCEKCAACIRVLSRQHPDVSVLLADAEAVERGWAGKSDFPQTPSWDIRIEQIRRLQERLSLRALEAPFKVALVLGADAMNPPAQNALLKTLEEPSANTVLVLVTSMPDRLLPTIRSRCVKAPFGPLAVEQVSMLLKRQLPAKTSDDEIERRARVAFGSVGLALSLNSKVLERQQQVVEEFLTLSKNDARGWLAWAEAWSGDRLIAEQALDAVKVLMADLVRAKSGATLFYSAIEADKLNDAATQRSHEFLLRADLLVDQAKNAIVARNGSARLQLERLLIELVAFS
jgi:DNA polymerase III subunit delta'